MKDTDLIKWLRSLGAEIKPAGSGSHHKIFLNGRQSVISVKRKDIPLGTLKAIVKQLNIEKEWGER